MEIVDVDVRAHVLRVRDRAAGDALTQARGQTLFRGQNEVGRTDHVIVYSDGTPAGDATAQAILQTAEADYQATQGWFGGIDLPPGQEGDDQTTPRTATPLQVLMDAQAGGAYHFGCDATDIYVEPTPELANGFFVAELVEIFEAAINNGWDCGHTNGEGLSRVLAGERNPNLGSLFVQTAQSWWGNGHADYTGANDADDTDQDSNGCATLFLFYLHTQLGFDWRQIVTTGGGTLGQTYQLLTGRSPADGFNDFVSRLATLDQGGQLALPDSGNPFPISGTAQAAPSPAAPVPQPQSAPAAAFASLTEVRRESAGSWGIPAAPLAYGEPVVEEVVIEEVYVTPPAASAPAAPPPPAWPAATPETQPRPSAPPAAAAMRAASAAGAPRLADAPDAPRGGNNALIAVIVALIVIVALALVGVLFISGIL